MVTAFWEGDHGGMVGRPASESAPKEATQASCSHSSAAAAFLWSPQISALLYHGKAGFMHGLMSTSQCFLLLLLSTARSVFPTALKLPNSKCSAAQL